MTEKIKVCPECGKIYMPDILSLLRPAYGNYCYDVIVEVGMARYKYFSQDREIQDKIFRNYGLLIPLSTISDLAQKFVLYFAAVHYGKLGKIRSVLAENPACVLNVDGTCEIGTSTFFALMDNASGFVLHCGKMPAERKENIAELLQFCADNIIEPDAVIQDLSPRIFDAVKDVFPESRLLICHYHFLENIGKKILKTSHSKLGALIKKEQISVSIKMMRDDLAKTAKKHEAISEEQLNDLWSKPDKINCEPKQLVRYLAYILGLWFADYKTDLKGEYFPFDLPYLSLYKRSRKLYLLLKKVKESYAENDFNKLRTIATFYRKLELFHSNNEVKKTAEELIKVESYFNELRKLLKMETPDKCPVLRQRKPVDSVEFIEGMKREFEIYTDKLKKIIDKKNNEIDKFCAENILKYFDKYADYLIGHIVYDKNKNGYWISPRTNNFIEKLFGKKKAALRRKIGKKRLISHFQAMLPEELLVMNLFNEKYCESILESKNIQLVTLFAKVNIDNDNTKQIKYYSKISGLNIRISKKFIRQENIIDNICAALIKRKSGLIADNKK